MRLFSIIFLIFFTSLIAQELIIDCDYTLSEALKGLKIPNEVRNQLILLDVEYYSFDSMLHKGQIIVNNNVKNDINELFILIKKHKFPVDKVVPVVYYNWDDDLSMKDNNTSGFNYRYVKGTKKLSKHSSGLAIDINPMLNPQIKKNGNSPKGSKYDASVPGTITKKNEVYKLLISKGWKWGGGWKNKDYQHFEK